MSRVALRLTGDDAARDPMGYAQARANATGRPYLVHGWIDGDGFHRVKVCANFKENRAMIAALDETLFAIVRPCYTVTP